MKTGQWESANSPSFPQEQGDEGHSYRQPGCLSCSSESPGSKREKGRRVEKQPGSKQLGGLQAQAQEGGECRFWGCFSHLSGAPNLVSLETQKQNMTAISPRKKTKQNLPCKKVVGCVHTQDRAVGHRFPGNLWELCTGLVPEGPWEKAGPSQFTGLSLFTQGYQQRFGSPVHTTCFWVLTDPRCEPRWVPAPPTLPPPRTAAPWFMEVGGF